MPVKPLRLDTRSVLHLNILDSVQLFKLSTANIKYFGLVNGQAVFKLDTRSTKRFTLETAMDKLRLYTGDNTWWGPLTVRRGNSAFNLKVPQATIKASIVDTRTRKRLTSILTVDETHVDSNWTNGIIYVNVPAIESTDLEPDGRYTLQLTVTNSDLSETFDFDGVQIMKGHNN